MQDRLRSLKIKREVSVLKDTQKQEIKRTQEELEMYEEWFRLWRHQRKTKAHSSRFDFLDQRLR